MIEMFEQFENICKTYPVFAGDLISKTATKKLVQCGLVTKDCRGDYVPTKMGLGFYQEILSSRQAIKGGKE